MKSTLIFFTVKNRQSDADKEIGENVKNLTLYNHISTFC